MSYTHYPEQEREQLPRPAIERVNVIFSATESLIHTVNQKRAAQGIAEQSEARAVEALNALNELKATPTERMIGPMAVEPAANDLEEARQSVDGAYNDN